MITKQSFIIYLDVDKNIKVGDVVTLIDGSALTLHEDHDEPVNNFYIVFSAVELGFIKPLKSYKWKVVETNITDRVASGVCGRVYLQDIVVECNNVKFRTNSTMVSKI